MTQHPAGTVTFLFTDIEGSTELAQKLPEAMPALLARHNTLLRQAIHEHNGYLFQVVGDAFCAAFHTAPDALDAALAAQRLLQQEAWTPTPIHVRMGLHTGAAQPATVEKEAHPYQGYATLARVQRVMSAAHGGQILLSNPSADLLPSELPNGVTLRDMGKHRLKGFPNPEPLWQVVAPGLPSDFPPLSTLSATPNNLAVQLSSFIGRERELAEIKSLLSAQRLVTLTGAGGTGKTRLALKAAADLLDEFQDGVWFIELAPLADPARVPETITATLGLPEAPGRTFEKILTDYIRSRQVLLILDNCEHLLQACAGLADHLLRTCPQLKILATSRQPLGIYGEDIFHVPSFAVPDPEHLPSVEALTRLDSVRLFVDRAVAAKSDFRMVDANAAAVARICHRLDGMPLALELAAARVKLMKVEEIAARLDDRFRLLTGGSRTALPRQQTLRGLIDWSYDLLDARERVLLSRLAVFAGGCTLEAAEEVCGDAPLAREDVLDLLSQLVEKSLVIADEQGEDTRYRMLETIRQYAHERLVESGELNEVSSRHLDFVLHFARDGMPELDGREAGRWRRRFETEYANIASALDWALASGEVERELDLAGLLFDFWHGHVHFSAGCKWLESGIDSARRKSVPAAVLVKALEAAGGLESRQSHFDRAASLLEQAWAGALELGDKGLIARTLEQRGLLAQDVGDWGRAQELLTSSLALYREQGNRLSIAWTLCHLGTSSFIGGDLPRAVHLLEEGLSLALELQHTRTIAWSSTFLGNVLFSQGDYERSAQLTRQALVGIGQINEYLTGGYGLYLAGALAGSQGQPGRGARLVAAAQAVHRAVGMDLLPASRPRIERIINSIRAQLDEASFQAAWAEGSAMTLEQAVAYALEEGQS